MVIFIVAELAKERAPGKKKLRTQEKRRKLAAAPEMRIAIA